MTFERVKTYFEKGYWSSAMVRTAVRKGIITKAEFELITGEIY